ncbi:hypothetical protein GAY31_11415 [Azospirillum brasilense]|nr:hypothetical protein [Azospirillum brasilense]
MRWILTDQAALLRVRKKLKDDFEFYSDSAVKIRTKDGNIKPFKINKAQKFALDKILAQWRETGKIRVIVLKGRQLGFSTLAENFIYWMVSQGFGKKAMVVTHHSDSTRALFDMVRRTHEMMPPLLKMATSYSSRRELVFDKLQSGYVVATASGDSGSLGRGETITHLHASELAFWPKSSAKEQWTGLIQAVPNSSDSVVIIESTANGFGNLYYDLWDKAVKGENEYLPIFIPWYWADEYRAPVSASFERTPEEEDLVRLYGLDNEQLQFRRYKIADSGREMFQQEYPMCPEEAFVTTGRPVFNPEQLVEMAKNAKAPLVRKALVGVPGKLTWENHARGELFCYTEHDPAEQYVIGADVALGVKDGDFSVAQVLDGNKQLVATWRGHVHPDYFGHVLAELGKFYNDARVIVESNNHGLTTLTKLRDLLYPNYYTEVSLDKVTESETVKLGFAVTVKTKPLIIDKLRASMREREIEIHDKTTLGELQTFIVTEEGRMEAEAGHHDDCVMALALANYVHEGRWQPIQNSEDWYVSAL